MLEPALWLIVLATAACLRLSNLGRASLWGDEIWQVIHARGDLVDTWKNTIFPPLNLMVLKAVVLLGFSEWGVRLPSALFGIVGVAAFMTLACHSLGRGTVLGAGMLLALNPFHVAVSREAKCYPLVILLTVVAALGLWKARRRSGWLWLFAVASLANMYTHTYSALLAACQVPLALWSVGRRTRRHASTLAPVAILALGTIPLAWRVLGAGSVAAQAGMGHRLFEPLEAGYYLRLLKTFGPGPRVLPAVPFLLLGTIALVRKRVLGALVLASVGGPILLVAVLRPSIYVDRFLASAVPFLLLCLAAGTSTLAGLLRRAGGVAVSFASGCLALALIPACSGFGVPPETLGSHRDDWRGVARFIHERAGPGDLVVLAQERRGWKELLLFYLRETEGVTVLDAPELPEAIGPADTVRSRWWVLVCNETFVPRTRSMTQYYFTTNTFAALVVLGRENPCTGAEVLEETIRVMEARLLLPMDDYDRPFHLVTLGDLKLALADTADAQTLYEKVLSLNPRFPQALSRLEKLARRQGSGVTSPDDPTPVG